ncbi:hypothetical protein PFLUV_G00069920 [Perca fluviatilis]|uniref:TMEM248/TMEM219 domain-containing protein n=1 Tax=Perca fluviatilis TaxID=8168 RepID=A0A6A5EIE6_PERFL|nr:hypothetical protein PFLUV_G00069920 [Perca fluviatilis]
MRIESQPKHIVAETEQTKDCSNSSLAQVYVELDDGFLAAALIATLTLCLTLTQQRTGTICWPPYLSSSCVPLAVTTHSNSGSLKYLGLQTALRASQLHLGGNEIVNVTLEVLSGNDTYTCLTINAQTHLLPMSLLPPECPASENNISPIHVEASNQLPTASQTCYSLRSKNDPTLTVMLTPVEQSVAVRHLLEVSVCLLGVCLLLCVAASLTHPTLRRYHWNGLDLQNEPLIDP